jgi:acyl carrier protein
MKVDILGEIKQILTEIFNVEDRKITTETYLVRDLGSESIDLLELAIALNSRFKIKVDEDDIFLKRMGFYVNEARQHGKDLVKYIGVRLPFLSETRVKEIIEDMKGIAPPLKVKDLVSYVEWQRGRQ